MTGEEDEEARTEDQAGHGRVRLYQAAKSGRSARVTRRVIAQGKYIRLVDVDGWEFAERCNARGVVAVVAITPDRRIVLTEQLRRAVGVRVIDLPAGLAGDTPGDENEALAIAAKRELVEEVGYDADAMVELATTPPSPGLTSELVTFFRADGLRKVSAGGGVEGEGIVVHEVPLAELDRFLDEQKKRGALIDVKLFAGLHLAKES